MKKFQPVSFAVGVLSGALVLFLVIGGMRFLRPARPFSGPGMNGGAVQQRQGGAPGMNLARMAQRLSMTEDELRAALGSGKTIRDISSERGIAFPDRSWGRDETGSGAAVGRMPPWLQDQSSSNSQASSTSSLPTKP